MEQDNDFLFFIVLFVLLFLLASGKCNADTYMSGMLGIKNSAVNSYSETKFLSLGYRERLPYGFLYQFETGGWDDNYGHGRRNSAFASGQVGLEAEGALLARVAMGPAIISTPDSYLGGRFPQFTEDLTVGIRDYKYKNSIGIKYKHFSSAGLCMPNVGRDLFGLEVTLPW